MKARPRIALFVLEALPNARAVRRFVADHAADIAFVGLSNAERPSMGSLASQVRRHVGRSGPGFLPYLGVNFGLPDLLAPASGVIQRLARTSGSATATPLKALCKSLNIPAMVVDDVNGAEVAAVLDQHRPDLIVAFHFDQIFSGATLAKARLGGLNVHPGLLPRHRGPVPTIHALAEEEPAFGVTVHHLAVTIDAGAILAQEQATLPPGTTATRASVLLHENGRRLLDRVLDEIALSGAVPTGRQVTKLPYCPFPSPTLLAEMRRRGRKLTDARDLRDAVSLSARA